MIPFDTGDIRPTPQKGIFRQYDSAQLFDVSVFVRRFENPIKRHDMRHGNSRSQKVHLLSRGIGANSRSGVVQVEIPANTPFCPVLGQRGKAETPAVARAHFSTVDFMVPIV
jgi:hypothetical protein